MGHHKPKSYTHSIFLPLSPFFPPFATTEETHMHGGTHSLPSTLNWAAEENKTSFLEKSVDGFWLNRLPFSFSLSLSVLSFSSFSSLNNATAEAVVVVAAVNVVLLVPIKCRLLFRESNKRTLSLFLSLHLSHPFRFIFLCFTAFLSFTYCHKLVHQLHALITTLTIIHLQTLCR